MNQLVKPHAPVGQGMVKLLNEKERRAVSGGPKGGPKSGPSNTTNNPNNTSNKR